MNSGFHWPYGRRENVLPVWASVRLSSGAAPFPRVIYTDRRSEGDASDAETPTSHRGTPDPYFCQSFNPVESDRGHLDSVSCASPLNSDKGRYVTLADLAAGYGEPEELSPGTGRTRLLSRTSAYPPRRDCESTPADSLDVERYRGDALAAMPELDAVSRPTPTADTLLRVVWPVPDDWASAGAIDVRVEVNAEGDYGGSFSPSEYPSPQAPAGAWDTWAQTYGYPYRGQPSVVFEVAVSLPSRTREQAPVLATAAVPTLMGSLDASLVVRALDASIVDEPETAPGSGADRLRHQTDGARVRVEARQVRCRTR